MKSACLAYNLQPRAQKQMVSIPENDLRTKFVQFAAQEKMMGITWWNVVDNCGAKGEPSVSGLFTRDMQAKPSYYALNQLINNEWKTNTTVQADESGKVQFRGFKGKYRITYKDKKGKTQVMEYTLK